MNSTPENHPLQAIKDAALSGNMITAIKLYRELYGVGLAEAKHAVEQLTETWMQGGTPSLPSPTAGPPVPADTKAQIRSALLAGNKITAIKAYRELHHVGLAEAKQAVDAMEAGLRLEVPQAFAATPGKGFIGCIVWLILLGALGGGIWLFLH